MSKALEAGIGAASGIIGMIGQNQRATKQHNRQKELMDIQNKNQKGLNQQGHELQMDMWNKTNYGAQMDHMKKAGLNPGLMYGQSGQGGQTGSQGGGSAASGSAAAPMDIGNAVQAGLAQAQIANLNADTEKKKAEANTQGSIADMNIEELNVKAADIAQKLQAAATDSERAKLLQEQQEVEKAKAKLTGAQTTTEEKKQALMGEQTKGQTIENANKILEGKLTQAKTGKTKEETTAIINKVAQDWQKLSQEMIGLNRQEIEKNIKAYEAKIKAEYPTMWEMIGAGMREFIGYGDSLTGKERTGYGDPQKR